MYKLAFTGHRPPKIGGYDETSPLRVAVKREIGLVLDRTLLAHPDLMVIVGGALGVDTDAAFLAHERGIPFHLYAPCHNQESKWPRQSQERYRTMKDLAASFRYIHDGPYTRACMQDRNVAMVRDCDALVAVWDGSSGGTGNCVGCVTTQPIIRIDPTKLK